MTTLRQYMQDVERTYILSALHASGTCASAARALGMARPTLVAKMTVLGIHHASPLGRPVTINPLPRVAYRMRLRRWDGSWTVGTCALGDLPVVEADFLLRTGEAELVMTQEPVATVGG